MKAALSDRAKKMLDNSNERKELLDALEKFHKTKSSNEIVIEIGSKKFNLKSLKNNS